MNNHYHTLKKDVTTEISIQKSRFLCHAKRVDSEEEALRFLAHIQKKHWDATHNCYAYRITDSIQKASDDGEPSGTAGRPILHVITTSGLFYTLIIVTRYFGGIKLGGGGLIRAYSQGASKVITTSGILEMSLHQELFFTCGYSYLSKIEHELRRNPYYVESMKYEETIHSTLWVPIDMMNTAKEQLKEWTNGQVEIKLGETAHKETPSN